MDKQHPAAPRLNLFYLWQKSWSTFWLYSTQLIGLAALLSAFTLLLTYISEGQEGVKIQLGLLPEPLLSEGVSDLRAILSISLAGIVGAVANAIASGAALRIVAQKAKSVGAALRQIVPFMLPLIIAGFLTTVAIFAGAILLIIPGIVFAVWFMFSETVIAIEGKGALEAMQKSRSLSKGRFFPVLLVTLFTLVCVGALSIFLGVIPVFGPLAIDLLLGPFMIVYLYTLYLELVSVHGRTRNETGI